MSIHSNKNKALQYMQLMKDYDQGDSLYDDTTYDIRNTNQRIEGEPTLSTKDTQKSPDGGKLWYSALVNDAWEVVQKSVETSDQMISTAWNTIESLGNNVTAASGHQRMPSQSLHSQGSSTTLVFPQSKEAMKMQQERHDPKATSDSPEMRQYSFTSRSEAQL